MDVKSEMSNISLIDNYIIERLKIASVLEEEVLPEIQNDNDLAAALYALGKVREDIIFLKFSGYSYINYLYNKRSTIFNLGMGLK